MKQLITLTAATVLLLTSCATLSQSAKPRITPILLNGRQALRVNEVPVTQLLNDLSKKLKLDVEYNLNPDLLVGTWNATIFLDDIEKTLKCLEFGYNGITFCIKDKTFIITSNTHSE